ncbi:MAG: zinc-binding dehydrogenase [Anaerolineales bacterium]|nr:zinc-binding dehydrogenase [Anaerolineales bacterium]
MKELLEAEKIVPVIDKRFPLSEVAEGMRWLENGRHHGKVVITIKSERVEREPEKESSSSSIL